MLKRRRDGEEEEKHAEKKHSREEERKRTEAPTRGGVVALVETTGEDNWQESSENERKRMMEIMSEIQNRCTSVKYEQRRGRRWPTGLAKDQDAKIEGKSEAQESSAFDIHESAWMILKAEVEGFRDHAVVAIHGKIGSGASSVANSILGFRLLPSSESFVTITQVPTHVRKWDVPRRVQVIADVTQLPTVLTTLVGEYMHQFTVRLTVISAERLLVKFKTMFPLAISVPARERFRKFEAQQAWMLLGALLGLAERERLIAMMTDVSMTAFVAASAMKSSHVRFALTKMPRGYECTDLKAARRTLRQVLLSAAATRSSCSDDDTEGQEEEEEKTSGEQKGEKTKERPVGDPLLPVVDPDEQPATFEAWPFLDEMSIEGPIPDLPANVHIIDMPGTGSVHNTDETDARKWKVMVESDRVWWTVTQGSTLDEHLDPFEIYFRKARRQPRIRFIVTRTDQVGKPGYTGENYHRLVREDMRRLPTPEISFVGRPALWRSEKTFDELPAGPLIRASMKTMRDEVTELGVAAGKRKQEIWNKIATFIRSIIAANPDYALFLDPLLTDATRNTTRMVAPELG